MSVSDLFGGLDVAGAPEVGIADGKHEGTLVKFERTTSKAGDPFIVFYYNVKGMTLQEWKALPPSGNAQSWDRSIVDDKGLTEYDRNQRSLGFIQARLAALGVPKDRMNTVRPEDIAGMPVIVTTRRNDNGFPSVANATAKTSAGVSLPTGGTPQVVSAPAGVAVAGTAAPEAPGWGGDNPFA